MLSKSRRLSSAEVALVIKTGKTASAGPIRIKYLPRTQRAAVSRFAIVVSKKVAKLAVQRNLARRRAYASLKGSKVPFPIDGAIFLSTLPTSIKDLERDISLLFTRMQRPSL